MPTYEYLCQTCSHRFETWQKMTADPLTTCPECGSSIRRVVYPAGVVFKGSGFYKTDHGSNSAVASETSSDSKKSAVTSETSSDGKKAESAGQEPHDSSRGLVSASPYLSRSSQGNLLDTINKAIGLRYR